jgi:hypothetical protein
MTMANVKMGNQVQHWILTVIWCSKTGGKCSYVSTESNVIEDKMYTLLRACLIESYRLPQFSQPSVC